MASKKKNNTSVVFKKPKGGDFAKGKGNLPKKEKVPSRDLPQSTEGKVFLTDIEAETLRLLAKGFNTSSKLASRRKVTRRAVNYTLNNLRKKGVLGKANLILPDFDHTREGSETGAGFLTVKKDGVNKIRLHGEHWNIRVLFQGRSFPDFVRSKVMLDGNSVMVHKNSVDVYSNKSFYSDQVRKATVKGLEYWTRFFRKLEDRLDAILVKEGYNNIKRVQAHYAEVNNGLSKAANLEGEKIRVYAVEDGKLWFEIDNSLNLHEAETTHPETAEGDMADVVRPVFNDLRDFYRETGEVPTFREILRIVRDMALESRETAAGLHAAAEILKNIVPGQDSGLVKVEKVEGVRPDYVG